MTNEFDANNNNLRFFSKSSVFKKQGDSVENEVNDPTPFGLTFKEEYPNSEIQNAQKEQPITMSQCTTNLYPSTDNCIDIDYH